jgi:hypothetical protein
MEHQGPPDRLERKVHVVLWVHQVFQDRQALRYTKHSYFRNLRLLTLYVQIIIKIIMFVLHRDLKGQPDQLDRKGNVERGSVSCCKKNDV